MSLVLLLPVVTIVCSSLNFILSCILDVNVALLTAVPQMSVLTMTQQKPPHPQGVTETQICKWTIVSSKLSCTFMAACCLLAGLPPLSSTISEHASSPQLSLEPAIVTSPPHLVPQAYSGNIVANCLDSLK